MAYLSAGVYIQEIDNSAIVPTVSNSVAFFAGNFTKGPIEQPFVVTNKKELEYYFGKPTNTNYNEWFQCSKYLDYSNQLVVSRAFTELKQVDTGILVPSDYTIGSELITNLISVTGIYKGSTVAFSGHPTSKYVVTAISYNSGTNRYSITVADQDSNELTTGLADTISTGETIILFTSHQNAGVDAQQDPTTNGITPVPFYNQSYDLYKSKDDFVFKSDAGISFDSGVKLKFIAQTAGSVNNDIEIAICNPIDFSDYNVDGETGTSRAQAFDGESLVDFFDYIPLDDEIGIIIKQGDVTESFIVSFDVDALDGNNKSKYVETVINENSNLVYVVDNTTISKKTFSIVIGEDELGADIVVDYSSYMISHLFQNSQGETETTSPDVVVGPLSMFGGENPTTTIGDLKIAYDEVLDKELYQIDIVIGNELDGGAAAVSLADTRKDCIAFIGARYEDTVGKKSGIAVSNLVSYIKANNITRSMFASFFGNYHRIYDNFAKKYRWINCAGDMSGLRANTNTNRASWWASAGLKRGIIRNVDKLAFSPSEPQRDNLYKNSINPIVNFPGEGLLCWGQKTLLNYASSFDRINVRGLFNTLERAMSKAAKSSVFEFNDPFTRNAILAMFNPYLSSVKAGRGVSDFLVVCDETNNTADVISRNELKVDIYIKPMYAAEFIVLAFNNVGTRSFSSVIGV